MQKISRFILTSVFVILLISSGCNLYAPTRIPVGPIGFNPTSTPEPTETDVVASNTPVTPVIPITGDNAVLMQCQFCVNELAHAILIFPEAATFNVEGATTPVTCLTAKVVNGKRVLICHGTQLTSFNLKICSDAENCLFFPVALQECPLVPNTGIGTPRSTGTPMTPVFLTPLHTPRPTYTEDISPTSTSPSGVTPSPPPPTSAPSNTPVPTSIPPTVEPTTPVDTPVPTSILPTLPTDIINTVVPLDETETPETIDASP